MEISNVGFHRIPGVDLSSTSSHHGGRHVLRRVESFNQRWEKVVGRFILGATASRIEEHVDNKVFAKSSTI